jgi:hypothetical protein
MTLFPLPAVTCNGRTKSCRFKFIKMKPLRALQANKLSLKYIQFTLIQKITIPCSFLKHTIPTLPEERAGEGREPSKKVIPLSPDK